MLWEFGRIGVFVVVGNLVNECVVIICEEENLFIALDP